MKKPKQEKAIDNSCPSSPPMILLPVGIARASSVDRIVRRADFKRLCLGEGENGLVRDLRKEVEAYEALLNE